MSARPKASKNAAEGSKPFEVCDISCVIPAKNEELSIGNVVRQALKLGVSEVIVVDDGSTDKTAERAQQAGARIIRHPYSKGNGAAIKSGARQARANLIAMFDADGQHDPSVLPNFLSAINDGFDLVIGARSRTGQASGIRSFGNSLYNKLASWIVGQPVADLTSGFRLVRRRLFLEVISMLPNGFSYPTTSTMAFYRSGHSVSFELIDVKKRQDNSNSHISLWKDGGRFLLIIFRISVLYSPLKIFFPTALAFFLGGTGYYLYTFFMDGRFTNFGALLLTTSVVIFLIGLVSEQITALTYMSSGRPQSKRE